MKDESLYKVSALMGNSPETCRRHYAALQPGTLTDAVEFDDVGKPDLRCGPRLGRRSEAPRVRLSWSLSDANSATARTSTGSMDRQDNR